MSPRLSDWIRAAENAGCSFPLIDIPGVITMCGPQYSRVEIVIDDDGHANVLVSARGVARKHEVKAPMELEGLLRHDLRVSSARALVITEACARAAHEVNRAYCVAIGDTSQLSWEDAPEWQKSSAVAGVNGALMGNTPAESHASWMRTRLADGWRYGPVKDPEKKTHPCLVPYDDLPPEQRAKDALFVKTVRAVAGALGLIEQGRDHI